MPQIIEIDLAHVTQLGLPLSDCPFGISTDEELDDNPIYIRRLLLPETTTIEARLCSHEIAGDTDWTELGHTGYFDFTTEPCSVPHDPCCNNVTHLRVTGPFEVVRSDGPGRDIKISPNQRASLP
jgi:hypothetical protein